MTIAKIGSNQCPIIKSNKTFQQFESINKRYKILFPISSGRGDPSHRLALIQLQYNLTAQYGQ